MATRTQGETQVGYTGLPRANARPLILLAEADEHRVEALRAPLAALGCRVRVVSDALQTVLQAQREVPALVILADSLPGGSSADVVRRLRGCAATAQLPIVINGVQSPEPLDGARAPDYNIRLASRSLTTLSVLREVLLGLGSARIMPAAH